MPDTFSTEFGTGLAYETCLFPSLLPIDLEPECGRNASIPKSQPFTPISGEESISLQNTN